MNSRSQELENISDQQFDLCVIGGGATGSACALDAQLRGIRTVLLEGAILPVERPVQPPRSSTAECVTWKKPSRERIFRNIAFWYALCTSASACWKTRRT